MNTNKALLLDFDGVLFRHKSAVSLVSNKAARFVKINMKISNKDSHIINDYLYKSFGHTSIGLNKIGYNVNIDDFNHFIYNDIDYKNVFKFINSKDIADINNITKTCFFNNIKIYIFSNSPIVWCKNIIQCMNLDFNNFNYINNMNLLKPQKKLFNLIENELHDCNHIYFIDDTFINFTHTLNNPKWTNIMFDKKNIIINSNINLKIINDLNDIFTIISPLTLL